MHDSTWEKLARKDPAFYILTSIGRRPDERSMREFFESGVSNAASLFEEVQCLLPATDLVVEIGCGIGRLLLPMATRFACARGIDIAPTMLLGLEENAARAGRTNIQAVSADATWGETDSVDLVYSWLTLQHIADDDVIESYVRRTAALLKPDGVAYFQFDTRLQDLRYRVRRRVPAWCLPGVWRPGVRRIRRRRVDLVPLFEASGLRIAKEYGQNTSMHIFVLQNTGKTGAIGSGAADSTPIG